MATMIRTDGNWQLMLADSSWNREASIMDWRYFIVGKESIWISYEKKEWDYVKIPWLNRSAGGWNWVNPTYELAKEYEMLNGKLPEEAESGYDFNDPGKNRDPRFKATISYPGAQYDAYGFKPWQGGSASHLQSQKTGMCLQKYIDPLFNDALGLPRNLRKNINHLFRYNEILLIYAEAMNEAYGPEGVTDELNLSARDAINMVRGRSGLGIAALTSEDVSSKKEFRQALRKERMAELAFEDHRLWDARRWMIATDVLNADLTGVEIRKNENETFTYKKINVEKRVFSPKMYFYPIPGSVILNEQVMAAGWPQNPLW